VIAEITINEQWGAVPLLALAVSLFVYAIWPASDSKRMSLIVSFLCVFGAFAFWWLGDPPSSRPLPSPSPNVPVNVTPAGKLADLVPREVQGKVGRYYLSLASVIENAANITTTEQLREAYVQASKLMKSACQLPEGLAAFSDATNKLFTDSLTLNSQQLTPELRAKFANTCRGIASELGVTQ